MQLGGDHEPDRQFLALGRRADQMQQPLDRMAVGGRLEDEQPVRRGTVT